MRIKVLFYVGIIASMFLCTSCFDVVEEIDMRDNGAGKIKLTVNLSKSKTKVASLMKLDKVDGIKVPSEKEIRTELAKVTDILTKTKGISNVKSSLDFTNYIGTLSCDFTDINALNTFTKTLSTQFKTKLSDYSVYSFNANTKTLSRSYKYNSEGKKELSKLSTDHQKSMQDAFFTYIYRFDSPIAKQQMPQAKLSANKKAVFLKVSVLDLVNGKVDLSNSISLN